MNLQRLLITSLVSVVAVAACGQPESPAAQDSPSEGASYSAGPSTEAPLVSLDEVRKRMIEYSIFAYPGTCPCPYSRDRVGRPP